MRLSIIVPVLNDARPLAVLVPQLEPFRARGAELIVVDGGSTDASRSVGEAADQLLFAARGRAAQQHAGALASSGDALWFVHADSSVPPGADSLIAQALSIAPWGRFDVQLQGRSRALPVVAAAMNLRSRLSGIATGDQGIFVRRAAYFQVGGFPQIALMEDIALSAALKRTGAPACLSARITSSGRRWDTRGALATIAQMSWLRLQFWAGVAPEKLHAQYYGAVKK
jgi:rSAM/selenodomain-associated transferase 2